MAQQTDHIPDVRKKLTAVEWIEERLTLSLGDEIKDLRGFFVIAKEMEKQQIKDAVNQNQPEDVDGIGICDTVTKGEQYYKETYGK